MIRKESAQTITFGFHFVLHIHKTADTWILKPYVHFPLSSVCIFTALHKLSNRFLASHVFHFIVMKYDAVRGFRYKSLFKISFYQFKNLFTIFTKENFCFDGFLDNNVSVEEIGHYFTNKHTMTKFICSSFIIKVKQKVIFDWIKFALFECSSTKYENINQISN